MKKAERAQAQREAAANAQGGGYMRGELAEHAHVPAYPNEGGEVGSRAPDVSPGSTQRSLMPNNANQANNAGRGGVTSLADGFRPELSPQKEGPTFGVGQGGNDEWGDGLGDELLP